MKELLKETADFILTNFGANRILLLFVLSLAALLLLEKRTRKVFTLPALFFTILLFNPLSYKYVLVRLFSAGRTEWRALWLLPAVFVTAWAFAGITTRMKRPYLKYICAGVLAALVCLNGPMVYSGSQTAFTPAENAMKLPAAAVDVAQQLLEYDDAPYIVADSRLNCYLRQVSGQIRQMYGRDAYGYIQAPDEDARICAAAMDADRPDAGVIRQKMLVKGCTYLVIGTDKYTPVRASFQHAGFTELSEVDGYRILSLSDRAEKTIVTEYPVSDGMQGSFWTVLSPDGELTVIDGGYRADAADVVRVIRAKGGHVGTWIITHMHPDHAGAFNAIMQDPALRDSITVDRVLTIPVNAARYSETARDYDDIDTYRTFAGIAETLDHVYYVHENDTFEVSGLQMKVLHAWDAAVDSLSSHQMNDGSMMFTLRGGDDAFLFCADVQKEMEPEILAGHSEDLRCRYVQCGHHGNWGLSEDFYSHVGAAIAFMDAPAAITADQTGSFDAPALLQWFRDNQTEVFSFTDAPMTVLLQ